MEVEKDTITFDANGGTGTMESVTVEAGTEYTFPECEFVKNGWTFQSWQINDGEYAFKMPGSTIIVTEDLVVKPFWHTIGTAN